MTQALIDTRTGEIMDPYEVAGLKILDTYGESPVSDEETRIDALATISAGKRGEGKDGHAGLPMASRDGRIVLHDDEGNAPALKAALEATDYKRLTIAFPFDNPAAFVQSYFTEYSSTHLLAFGDEYAITVVDKSGTRTRLEQGSEAYDAARRRCKVSTSVYFALAEWDPEHGPQMRWDDGMKYYRLRFSSRNSLRILGAAIAHVQSLTATESRTAGPIRGVPFDLAIDYRNVAGPDGSRRRVNVWTFNMRPPGGIIGRTLGTLLRKSISEGERLMIAPPAAETDAVAEGDFREMGDDETMTVFSDDEVALLARGGRCDAAYYERIFFRCVRGTSYESDEARAALVEAYTRSDWGDDRYTSSLAEFLAHSDERDASSFIAHLDTLLDAEPAEERQAKAETLAPALAPPRRDAVERINAMRPDDDYVDGTPRRSAPPAQPMPEAVAAEDASVPPAEFFADDDADSIGERPAENIQEQPASAVGADIPISSTHDPKWQAWLALAKLANDAGAGESVPTLARPEQVPMLASELRAHYGALQAAVKAARQTTA